jgi:hypothetical protein
VLVELNRRGYLKKGCLKDSQIPLGFFLDVKAKAIDFAVVIIGWSNAESIETVEM